ncbi:MAG: 3,4-dihydroxy-2-butanone-4-phosphate synthase, partial [Lentisphaerae bacterium]|nr:3,4-dihydroxy-2-butanone-4-phosphate synthase [Lentisphaerota bacterium]
MFDPIDDVIKDMSEGRFVVIADDESRENEGDLIIAGDKITDAAINFMVTHARGLVCVAMTGENLQRLGISRMCPRSSKDRFETAFMESVDARREVSTGISAPDRAKTIQVLANPNSVPEDLVRPGHIFPLEARPGGVLRRAGHTEAAVDLAVLAGLSPIGVICEIMREDGEMARLPDLLKFSKENRLKISSVADLIAYRRKREKLIVIRGDAQLPTKHGDFKMILYKSTISSETHIALVMGEPEKQESPLVRVHSECLTGDVFGSLRCDCGTQLDTAMQMI